MGNKRSSEQNQFYNNNKQMKKTTRATSVTVTAAANTETIILSVMNNLEKYNDKKEGSKEVVTSEALRDDLDNRIKVVKCFFR